MKWHVCLQSVAYPSPEVFHAFVRKSRRTQRLEAYFYGSQVTIAELRMAEMPLVAIFAGVQLYLLPRQDYTRYEGNA
jgi:hypothetical protein